MLHEGEGVFYFNGNGMSKLARDSLRAYKINYEMNEQK